MPNPTAPVRETLRALSVFPATLPAFRPADAPDEPRALFLEWLYDAIERGVPAPHAMTLSTTDMHGRAAARVLILKDVDDAGWHFAVQSDSPKGCQLARNPQVALTFYWPELGRQVRVQGTAVDEGVAASASDFLDRPDSSRAGALVGRQSQPLGDPDEYRSARAQARERIADEPDLVAPSWTAYAVRPATVEFWQAAQDRAHARLRYEHDGRAWRRELLWP